MLRRILVPRRASLALVLAASLLVMFVASAHGAAAASTTAEQTASNCQASWIPTFGGEPGVNDWVYALTEFDDGNGRALYVAGDFTSVGGIAANRIARWNGTSWSALGSGMDFGISCLTVFDDGSGPALYAGGGFTTAGGVSARGVAKWNGTSWSALNGLIYDVVSLAVFDDGSGPALYAGGYFSGPNRIAKWDGTNWVSVGGGMNLSGVSAVIALTVFNDGNGDALYAAGTFSNAGGVSAKNIARWDGTSWSPLGAGTISGGVNALCVFDDGNGDALYAGGQFLGAGTTAAKRVAKWDGTNWSVLGAGISGAPVRALAVFDDGNGPALIAGGDFTWLSGAPGNGTAKWNGTTWSALGTGTDGQSGQSVRALRQFDDGHGAQLCVGGSFVHAGGVPARNLAQWSGAAWSALGSGVDSQVQALAVFDDGGGAALYAGGSFTAPGGVDAEYIAKWNGSNWAALGTGIGASVTALTVFDDGGGDALYAGGGFLSILGAPGNHIAKWNGASWSPVHALGTNAAPLALIGYDDGTGPALYAGGYFEYAGGVPAYGIAKWDGASWSPLGAGLVSSTLAFPKVTALAVFDDGSGPALFAGGEFDMAGTISANNVAKWDGTQWSALGTGTDNAVYALAVFDDGGGDALYVGGEFTSAGGGAASRIARWNGASWSALGSGTDNVVYTLATFDDGSGTALHVGGSFTTAGGAPANHIAKWDGTNWTALGGGTNNRVLALSVLDDGNCNGPALFAGGAFSSAPDSGDSYIAKWGCAQQTCGTSYCTAGTTSNGCTASMSSSGVPSASAASGFFVSASNVEGDKLGLIFYGQSGAVSSPWGLSSSYLCVKTPQQRTSQINSGGNSGACDGVLSVDLLAWAASHPNALGVPFAAGDTFWSQAWFRDPPAPKTTALSNGLQFTLIP